jgi:hypothetical protein
MSVNTRISVVCTGICEFLTILWCLFLTHVRYICVHTRITGGSRRAGANPYGWHAREVTQSERFRRRGRYYAGTCKMNMCSLGVTMQIHSRWICVFFVCMTREASVEENADEGFTMQVHTRWICVSFCVYDKRSMRRRERLCRCRRGRHYAGCTSWHLCVFCVCVCVDEKTRNYV